MDTSPNGYKMLKKTESNAAWPSFLKAKFFEEKGERGTYDEPMLRSATIHLLHNGKAHPYLGARFLGLDGLAASALDTALAPRLTVWRRGRSAAKSPCARPPLCARLSSLCALRCLHKTAASRA